MLALGNTTMIPLNWKLRMPPSHGKLLMSLIEQEKKVVTMLAGVIDPS